MSIKSSGLWCDVCRNPILGGMFWHIGINGASGHACQKCKDEYEAREQKKKKAVEV